MRLVSAMKLNFQPVFRASIFILLAVWLWAGWSRADEVSQSGAIAAVSTNAVIGVTTNATALLYKPFAGLNEDYLTFGLDRVTVLKETKVFGQPLWKFIASLIYIFLAFYVSKVLDFLTRVWL